MGPSLSIATPSLSTLDCMTLVRLTTPLSPCRRLQGFTFFGLSNEPYGMAPRIPEASGGSLGPCPARTPRNCTIPPGGLATGRDRRGFSPGTTKAGPPLGGLPTRSPCDHQPGPPTAGNDRRRPGNRQPTQANFAKHVFCERCGLRNFAKYMFCEGGRQAQGRPGRPTKRALPGSKTAATWPTMGAGDHPGSWPVVTHFIGQRSCRSTAPLPCRP